MATPPASPSPHWLALAIVAGGNAAVALAFSTASAEPLVDAKWLAVGLCTAALLIAWALRPSLPRPDSTLHPLLAGLAVLAIAILISALAADERAAALAFLPRSIAPLLWGAAVLTYPWNRRDFHILAVALVGLGFLVAVIGLAQYYAPAAMASRLGYGNPQASGRIAIISTIGNPEYLGGFLAPLVVLCICLIRRARSAPGRSMAAVALAVLFAALYFTESRGSWIGALAGFSVLWFLRSCFDNPGPAKAPRRRTRWIVASGLALLWLILLLPTPLNPYRVGPFRRVADLGDVESHGVRHRLLLYSVTSEMIRKHGYTGVGPGRYSNRFAQTLVEMRSPETEAALDRMAWELGRKQPGYVHNDWLQFWVNHGLLAAAAFLWLLAASIGKVWEIRRKGAGYEPFAMFAAAWFCIAVYSLFAFPFHAPDRLLLAWTLFGMMGAASARIQPASPRK